MVRRAPASRSASINALAAVAAMIVATSAADAACRDLLPDGHAPPSTLRDLTARDLVRLRDIGFPDAALPGPDLFGVSPDGLEIAFVLSRADPDSNSYCRALVVMPIARGALPRIVDAGGEFPVLETYVRGLSARVGLPKPVTPTWSPDGRWIAYLKREKGVTQAWIAAADGSGARAATRSMSDVETVAWTDAGSDLLFTTRAGVAASLQAIEREGVSGWLYDNRVATNSGPRPKVREADAPLANFVVNIDTNRATTATEPALARASMDPKGADAFASSGRRAWTAPEDESLLSAWRLWATDKAGAAVRCGSDVCRNPLGYWWDRGGSELRFLRREGWNKGVHALYRWAPGAGDPVRILATEDALQNCVEAGSGLVCTSENAVTPRRVVLLDPATGRTRLIFDPNTEFAGIRLGSVRRLRVRNQQGLEAWADLVLPPAYRAGDKLPMVIVQYRSRGFLRGGTGDEYPIHLLAAKGFAVLSFERPPEAASARKPKTEVEANAASYAGWADRRSVLSALEAAIEAAVATGAVDPKRIGITGLSDGATSVRFALINTDRFAAASISSCCLEPKTVMTYGGIAWAEFNRAVGFPPATVDDPVFWRPMSLALNAARIDTPLLMQLSDDEHLLALEAFQALREHGKPVELYVFPGEHHIKWQPAHRLAIYNRNLDWFDFWLRCEEDSQPGKRSQYQRWSAMRASAKGIAACMPKANSVTTSFLPTPPHRPAGGLEGSRGHTPGRDRPALM